MTAPAEEVLSEGDEISVQDESGTDTTDGDFVMETSSSESSPVTGIQLSDPFRRVTPPDTPVAANSRVSHVAATKGLNVSLTGSERGNRHSKLMGLPSSPRLPQSPSPRPPDVLS